MIKNVLISLLIIFCVNVNIYANEVSGEDLEKILVENVLPKLTNEEVTALNKYIKYKMFSERLLTHAHIKNAAIQSGKHFFSDVFIVEFEKKLYDLIIENYEYTNIIREKTTEIDMPSDFVVMSCVEDSECDISFDQEIEIINTAIDQLRDFQNQ